MAKRDYLPFIFVVLFKFLVTHPLYPPPLAREGEDFKKRGFAPLKHLLVVVYITLSYQEN